MKNSLFFLVFLFVSHTVFAQDPTLPDVENLRIEDDTLIWDAQAGATGYNISLNLRYYDTVRDINSFSLSEPGTYRVIAFNNSGEYGSDYGLMVDFDGGVTDNSVSYSYDYTSLLVYQTCVNVGPGESCIARCPSSYKPDNFHNTIYPRYMTGGACTTSDIVEADSWIGHKSYHCTVPTFSGEVVAMAICLTR